MQAVKSQDTLRMADDMISFMKRAFLNNTQATLILQDRCIEILNCLVDEGILERRDALCLLGQWMLNLRNILTDFQGSTEKKLIRFSESMR